MYNLNTYYVMAVKRLIWTMVAMMVALVALVACDPSLIIDDDYQGFSVEGNVVYAFRSIDDGEITMFNLSPVRLVDDTASVSDTTEATDVALIRINEAAVTSTQVSKDLGITGRDKNIEVHSEVFTAKMSVPVKGARSLEAEFSFIKDVVYLVLENEYLCQELDFSYKLKGEQYAVELTNEGYLNYKYKFDLEIFESEYSIGKFQFERVFAVSPAG